MKRLHIRLSGGRGYDIRIGRGLLDELGPLLREIWGGSRVAVVTDSNVAPLYAERAEASLRKAGFIVKRAVFPAGEKSKNLAGLECIYDQLLSPGPFTLTRTDLIIALGGGVTGDMAGFAAGTVLRGVPYVQVPTTLLAQVDSSVGGKVAVDLKQGKNLAGLFYQPKLVLIDPDTLDTLPDRVFFDGMGGWSNTASSASPPSGGFCRKSPAGRPSAPLWRRSSTPAATASGRSSSMTSRTPASGCF